jgi:hypothetical protein
MARNFAQNVNVGDGNQISDGKSNGFELKVKPGFVTFRYDVEIKKITEPKVKGPRKENS